MQDMERKPITGERALSELYGVLQERAEPVFTGQVYAPDPQDNFEVAAVTADYQTRPVEALLASGFDAFHRDYQYGDVDFYVMPEVKPDGTLKGTGTVIGVGNDKGKAYLAFFETDVLTYRKVDDSIMYIRSNDMQLRAVSQEGMRELGRALREGDYRSPAFEQTPDEGEAVMVDMPKGRYPDAALWGAVLGNPKEGADILDDCTERLSGTLSLLDGAKTPDEVIGWLQSSCQKALPLYGSLGLESKRKWVPLMREVFSHYPIVLPAGGVLRPDSEVRDLDNEILTRSLAGIARKEILSLQKGIIETRERKWGPSEEISLRDFEKMFGTQNQVREPDISLGIPVVMEDAKERRRTGPRR